MRAAGMEIGWVHDAHGVRSSQSASEQHVLFVVTGYELSYSFMLP